VIAVRLAAVAARSVGASGSLGRALAGPTPSLPPSLAIVLPIHALCLPSARCQAVRSRVGSCSSAPCYRRGQLLPPMSISTISVRIWQPAVDVAHALLRRSSSTFINTSQLSVAKLCVCVGQQSLVACGIRHGLQTRSRFIALQCL
jgi:hypothetical protein